MSIIMGIDAGSGVKSATGIALFDPVGAAFQTMEIWPQNRKDDATTRMKSIVSQFKAIEAVHCPPVVIFESFAMRAKSGETLQRLIGALMATTGPDCEIIEVANTIVKQVIGGSGRSEKDEVANGLHAYFLRKNKSSAERVLALKYEQRWDELDSLAIAVAGYLRMARG